jgi:hypothetical protein
VEQAGTTEKLEAGGEAKAIPDNASVESGSAEGAEGGTKRVKLDDGNSAPPRIPWADPDTLAQLSGISSGCCVCTLRLELSHDSVARSSPFC